MRQLILVALLALAACDTTALIHQAGAEARKQCQELFDAERPIIEADIWQQCTDAFSQQLEIQLIAFGCTRTGGVEGSIGTWDCSTASVCKGTP